MPLIARIISVLLHPLWMPLFSFVLAFELVPDLGYFIPPKALWFNYLVIGVMTAVFPLIGALIMVRSRRIDGITMDDRRQRLSPMLSALMYYCLTYWLIRKYPHHPSTLSLFLGGIVVLLCTLVITFKWKISLHMAGIGGLIGGLSGLLLLFGSFSILMLVPLIVLAGGLGTARLVISDHTPAQVYVGALLGFVCVFATVVSGFVI